MRRREETAERSLTRRGFLAGALSLGVVAGFPPAPAAVASTAEDGVRAVIVAYERAIEAKDLDLFRSVKPNLSPEEEKRLRAAFASTGRHEVEIAVVSIHVDGKTAVAHLSRRDTLEGSIVSSFPQTLKMAQGPGGWIIEEIGR